MGKLGHAVGRSTIQDILKRQQVPPSPRRRLRASTRRQFLARHRDALLACDFFTVETVCVLFFLALGTRRVRLAGGTATPTVAWVTHQARQLSWQIQDSTVPARFLLRDRDEKFTPAFDNHLRIRGRGNHPHCPGRFVHPA